MLDVHGGITFRVEALVLQTACRLRCRAKASSRALQTQIGVTATETCVRNATEQFRVSPATDGNNPARGPVSPRVDRGQCRGRRWTQVVVIRRDPPPQKLASQHP